MAHPTRIVIDRAALRHNYRRVQSLAPGARVMAIIKADAYGHDATRIAGLLPEADAFGVACLEEARQLREAGIKQDIVLLAGACTAEDLPAINALQLAMVVHNHKQLDMLTEQPDQRHGPLWLKIDTGMHRLGFTPDALPEVLERCRKMKLSAPLRLMSHLACAHEPEHPMNQAQIDLFQSLSNDLRHECSLANSAALLTRPETHHDWVRPGLMLYGISPFAGREGHEHGLRPVMTLESTLISIRHLQAGEPVGYGASWHCPEATSLGIVAIGYADGYPRRVARDSSVLIHGKRCSLAGPASMDLLAVDLRNCPKAAIGDPVILWGPTLPIEPLAGNADTIPYTLLCRVHKRLRVFEVEG